MMKLHQKWLDIPYKFAGDSLKNVSKTVQRMRSISPVILAMCAGTILFGPSGLSAAEIHVDSCTAERDRDGTTPRPFRSLTEAMTFDAPSADDLVVLHSGFYPERAFVERRLRFEVPMTITARDGTAIIGKHGPSVGSPLRILTHNVRGKNAILAVIPNTVPPQFLQDCAIRGKAFGEMVVEEALPPQNNPYSIIALQEFFEHFSIPVVGSFVNDCDHSALLSPLNEADLYEDDGFDRRFLFRPRSGVNGGLGTFTSESFSKTEEFQWDPEYQACSRQGYTFTRVQTSPPIDVYNVHICAECKDAAPCTGPSGGPPCVVVDCRPEELRQLAEVISEESGTSGNPVLVMGDFNIRGPLTPAHNPPEYSFITDALKQPLDLWQEAHGDEAIARQAVTRDDCGIGVAAGSNVTCDLNLPLEPCCILDAKRIDYIFFVTGPELTNSRFTVRIGRRDDVSVVRGLAQLPPFQTVGLPPFQNGLTVRMSDHFGVEALISMHDCR